MDSIKKELEIVRKYYEKTLTLFDDRLFREKAENKAFVEELLGVLLEDRGLKVIENVPQKDFSILNQKGIILDCYCRLSDGRLVDIEVEKNDERDKCDHQRRVRYYGSMINVKNLASGEKYDDMPDVYIIYLTSKDIFKKGKTTYHVDRILRESNNVVDNGYHEIYINAEINDNTDISELMKVMSTQDYINKNFKVISEVKEETTMPVEVENALEKIKIYYREEGMEKGMKKGKAEGKAEACISMYKQGIISESVVLSNLNITKEELTKMMKEYA